MSEDKLLWREPFGTESPKPDEYIADTRCTNGCGFSGRRFIFVKKGVLRSNIDDVKCEYCGCKAAVQ